MNKMVQRLGARWWARRCAFSASLGILAVSAAFTVAVPVAARAQDVVAKFDIPAQPLENALIQLGRETSLQFFFTPETVAGLSAPALRGSMTPIQALEHLLRGTPVSYRQNGRNITLSRAAAATQLDAVTVLGARETATGPVNGYVARRSATATKTDTPILETPQTINVVSADQMAAQGATSIDEALSYTPGVANEFYGGATYNDYLRLRGFAAPLYSEGMHMPSGLRDYARLRLEPYGLERVEVLKGPSSVLYGQGAPGGMVNAVRKRPTAERIRQVEVTGGSYDRIQGAFDFGGAIDPEQTFLYRLTGLARDSGTQVDYLEDNRVFIAPSLTWKPSADTMLTIFTHYQRDVGGNSPLPALGTLYPTEHGYLPVNTYLGYSDFNRYEREQFSLGYEFEHRFSDMFKVRQKLEYSDVSMDYQYPYLSGIASDAVTGAITMNRAIWNSNDRATALTIDNTAQVDFVTGSLQHTALLGVDYSRLDFDSLWGGVGAGTVDIFNPQHTGRPADPTLYPDQDGVQYQTGFYAQDQIKWNRWVLALGGRYDLAKNTVHDSNYGTTTRQRDEAFTGRVGLVYLFDNGIAPYASYSTSFEPTAGADAAGAAFKPTTAQQFEAGVRYQPSGADSYIGISAYQLTQKNVLTQDPSPPDTNPWAQVQTGKVRVRGIELEGKANLAAGLDLIASYAYQNSEIIKTNYAAQLGNRFQLTPVHQAALWVDYTFRTGAFEGFGLGGGVRHIASRFGDLDNLIELPSITLFNAAVSYDFGKKNPSLEGLTLRVNATNLFDKRYVASCASLTSANCYYGQGRTVFASLGYKW